MDKLLKNNNTDVKDSKNSFLIIFIVLFLTISGLFYYNYNKNLDYEENYLSNFIITKNIIEKDFENSDIKLYSDVIPPDSYKDKFTELINNSLSAIESGESSDLSSVDLREDYLNIASSFSILGNYENSERYYLELIKNWPDDYKGNMNLGDLYIMMEQYRSSANKYLDTIYLYPNDFRIYIKFADLYIKHSVLDHRLDRADQIYIFAIKQANNPRELYKNYSFFLENYLKDYERALDMEREYQKISGDVSEEEIKRLQDLINSD